MAGKGAHDSVVVDGAANRAGSVRSPFIPKPHTFTTLSNFCCSWFARRLRLPRQDDKVVHVGVTAGWSGGCAAGSGK